ncbi:MAG: hypothetical protein DCF12_00190 [Snowella sp.]|jgi:hypothetical protein|nr:MAG: hypothetical protein DCF12_00190 [Snowella sp.]
MTINEEKIDFSRSEVSYSNFKKADIDLLISLLGEYGEKLINLCEKINDNKQKYSLGEYFLPRLGGGIVLITWSIFSSQTYPHFVILGILIFALFTTYVAVSVRDTRKKIKLSEREAKKISSRLEKVIRIASQTQDNLSKTPPNWIIRVELDLRLADAESALEYYQEIIGK